MGGSPAIRDPASIEITCEIRMTALPRFALPAACLMAATFGVQAEARTSRTVAISPDSEIVGQGVRTAVRLRGSASAGFALMVNGRAVSAVGRRHWHADVPLAALRDWSAPFAREIVVTLTTNDAAGMHPAAEQRIKLPTGALGRDPARPIRLSAR
jgi:hypothetical protein